MRQLRSNALLGWVGLAALAIQFVFAFGHHHAHESRHEHYEVYNAQASLRSFLPTSHHDREHEHDHLHEHEDHPAHGLDQGAPGHQEPGHECPTCWTVSLLAALALPTLAALGVFYPKSRGETPPDRKALASSRIGSSYLARGPPAYSFC